MVEGQYVQCVWYQSAECPIVVGGIYKVLSVVDGALCFDRCKRGHSSEFFKEVPSNVPVLPIAFKEGAWVRLRSGVLHGSDPCPLTPGLLYRAGTIDDWHRVFVHHEACKEWHSADAFEMPLERSEPLKLIWNPYLDVLGNPCIAANFLCHALRVGETNWNVIDHSRLLVDGSCTSQLDGQTRAEAWLKQYLRPTFEQLYGGS